MRFIQEKLKVQHDKNKVSPKQAKENQEKVKEKGPVKFNCTVKLHPKIDPIPN